MITIQRAYELRTLIEKAVSQGLDDDDALNGIELYPRWAVGVKYALNDRISYNEKLYKVVQAHTSQSDWLPDNVPALYTEVVPSGVIPIWKQPTGAQDAYNIGDRVRYPDEQGSVYESLINGNVWSPQAYPAGWKVI